MMTGQKLIPLPPEHLLYVGRDATQGKKYSYEHKLSLVIYLLRLNPRRRDCRVVGLRRNWSSSPRRLWFFYCRKSHFSSLGSAWYVAAMKKAGWASALVAVILLAVAVIAAAQQPAKIPRIGYLGFVLTTDPSRTDAFRQGLRDLGYVEGKNIVIEWRLAEGNPDRVPTLLADLVRLKV